MDISQLDTKEIVASIAGASIGLPSLWLLFKRFLVKNLVSDADLTVVKTYIELIENLKTTNDHLVEQNDNLLLRIKHLEEEIEYLKNELMGFGLRREKR